MSTFVRFGIGIAVVVGIVIVFPSLKGPYNRIKNNVNEKLNDEYCVDNYKATYVNLHDKKVECEKSIAKFNIETKVLTKKIEYSRTKAENAKNLLKTVNPSDLDSFSRAKSTYETFLTEIKNYEIMLKAYSDSIAKLERTKKLIETNMIKAKANVSSLESKKECVDTLKSVNGIVEDLKGVGNVELSESIERLDDSMVRESIKCESLSDEDTDNSTEEDNKKYLEGLN